MSSFRRFAFLLALGLPTLSPLAGVAQSTSSSADAAPAAQSAPATNSQLSVQARIRARREQRRMALIHDTYDHPYEAYLAMGYMRTKPGPHLQNLTEYAWNAGLTHYYNERLGVSLDGRGNYGTAYTGLNITALTRPAISQYSVMIGPTYRFYIQPKYSVGARVLAGVANGNFSSDTNGFGTSVLGLYADNWTYSASASVYGEYNISPRLSLRLAPEVSATGYGSEQQLNPGFTAGFAFRIGKK